MNQMEFRDAVKSSLFSRPIFIRMQNFMDVNQTGNLEIEREKWLFYVLDVSSILVQLSYAVFFEVWGGDCCRGRTIMIDDIGIKRSRILRARKL